MKYWAAGALIAGFLALVSLLLEAQQAHGQSACRKSGDWATHLWKGYKEIPFSRGLVKGGDMELVLYLNENTKTWTIVLFALPHGCTFSTVHGDNYQQLASQKAWQE